MNIIFYCVLMAMNFFIWQVYDLPLEPVIYVMIICTVFLIIAESIQYINYRTAKKEIDRQLAMNRPDPEHVPVPKGKLGKDYREFLKKQEGMYNTLESLSRQRVMDMKRYYGLLVHQIKTPIAGISLLLSEEEIDRRAVKRELYRVEQYVDTILWYQRFQEGNHDLLLQEYSGEEIVKQTIKRNSVLLLRKDIRIELDLDPCMILTDRKWLDFILDQLLGNAEKYTKMGTIRIEMKKEEDCTDISVMDTGIGIREEDLHRIFEWGYTGYNGHENRKSTGIGLALCRQAADLLGYKILVSSRVGEGTRMTVRMHRSGVNLKE